MNSVFPLEVKNERILELCFLLGLALFAMQEEQMQPDMQTPWEVRARNTYHGLQGCSSMGMRQVASWFWRNWERCSSEPQPRVRTC